VFVNNFGKCGPIFTILSPIDSCTYYKDFYLTCNMMLHLPCEIRKSKNVAEFSR